PRCTNKRIPTDLIDLIAGASAFLDAVSRFRPQLFADAGGREPVNPILLGPRPKGHSDGLVEGSEDHPDEAPGC
ncbi:hypothetical protein LCGC14_2309490, partial [marine sediment metagenome]